MDLMECSMPLFIKNIFSSFLFRSLASRVDPEGILGLFLLVTNAGTNGNPLKYSYNTIICNGGNLSPLVPRSVYENIIMSPP